MHQKSGTLNPPKLASEHGLALQLGGMPIGRIQYLDLASGQRSYQVPVDRNRWDISPDGKTLIAVCEEPAEGLIEHFALKLGLSWPFPPKNCRRVRLYDSTTGESLGDALGDRYESRGGIYDQKDVLWLPSGQGVALHDFQSNGWQIWDIPARKSLSQFVLWSLALAVAMAYFGWISGRLMRVRLKHRQSPSDSVPLNTASPSPAAP
jgi:hypothetical protein